MQWANGNAELDRLKRFCIAYDYVQAERIRDSRVGEVEQLKAKITEIDDDTEKKRKKSRNSGNGGKSIQVDC